MKILILGGTFNPPHLGHERILKTAMEHLKPDLCLMIPTGIPPHKSSDGVASKEDRLEMCRLSAENIGALACDIELKRQGRSYTVLTLEDIKKQYPSADIYLIVGADMLVTFKQWYRYDDLIRLASIVAFYRDDTDRALFDKTASEIERDGGRVELISIPPDKISSTEIRERIKSGSDVLNLLSENVLQYIKKHNLYK